MLYPSQFCCISQTQREKLICASNFESEIIYSLLRIGLCRKPNTVHQHPWVGVPLVWMSVYLDWAWMTPEADPAFTLKEPGQSCHFLDQKLRNTASGRYHPGSRSPAHAWGLCSLEICCISSPANSGEDRIHTSQPETYLPLPSYPELACSQVCFVFSFNFFLSFFFLNFPPLVKIKCVSEQMGKWGPMQEGPRCVVLMMDGVGEGKDWVFGIIRYKLIYRGYIKSYYIYKKLYLISHDKL